MNGTHHLGFLGKVDVQVAIQRVLRGNLSIDRVLCEIH